ncbi:hypothetical protein [Geobacter sulfurreducens]|uniref:hypothetical protein n=1 Tax=Geobacter sulfurreducens TaxID=35554 RepID=UPI0001E342ED|nr:hypothetical protein [Geobacter sulfurreducens]ADN78329.1 hypothetical protein KN400_3432 [Geobacter sulfurreducens KN400]
MTYKWLVVMALAALNSGCIPFMTNEQQTALWMSKEKRVESFKRDMDFRRGKEFYVSMPKTEWCKTNQCSKINDSITEYIEDPDRVLTGKCVVAWRVDEKQSTGNYQYGAGPVYYGLGRFRGDSGDVVDLLNREIQGTLLIC